MGEGAACRGLGKDHSRKGSSKLGGLREYRGQRATMGEVEGQQAGRFGAQVVFLAARMGAMGGRVHRSGTPLGNPGEGREASADADGRVRRTGHWAKEGLGRRGPATLPSAAGTGL